MIISLPHSKQKDKSVIRQLLFFQNLNKIRSSCKYNQNKDCRIQLVNYKNKRGFNIMLMFFDQSNFFIPQLDDRKSIVENLKPIQKEKIFKTQQTIKYFSQIPAITSITRRSNGNNIYIIFQVKFNSREIVQKNTSYH